MEDKEWSYLAVGGELHGNIYDGPANLAFIDLPLPERRLAQFVESTTAAKVTPKLAVTHKVHIHTLDGKQYAIAYLEPKPAENAINTPELETLIYSTKLTSI